MKTHWKKLRNPDYLGSWDFQPGQEIILTIQSIKEEIVKGTDGKKDKCTVLHFVEKMVDGIKIKPLILNVANAKMIQKLYETPYIEDWPGFKIQLRVESVKAFGDVVDAVRVRKIKPRVVDQKSNDPIICETCGETIVASEASPDWTPARIANKTLTQFGKILCLKCASEAREPEDEPAEPMSDPLAENQENKENKEND